jgi:hypothetical protein
VKPVSEGKSAEADVRQKLTRIKALKTRLDSVDAEIGTLLPRVEAMLDSLRLGVPIRVEIGEGPNGHPIYLAFTKVGKDWRLCVEQTTDAFGTELETRPLSELGRDERAIIFDEYLHDVLDHAVEEVERRIKRREGTLRSVAEMVEAVEKALRSEQRASAAPPTAKKEELTLIPGNRGDDGGVSRLRRKRNN